jgi:hypothetical protein
LLSKGTSGLLGRKPEPIKIDLDNIYLKEQDDNGTKVK